MMMTTNVLSFRQTCLFWMLLVLNIYGGHSKFGGDGAKCREREQIALLQFKAELIDEYGRLSSWGSTNCCEWKGVVCDNRTNHVVALDLHGRGGVYGWKYDPLRGKIDSSLLQLTHLQYLDLSFNDFNATTIPNFIGDLSKLQHLNLTYSNLTGPIPHHIGNLSALRHLDLHGNGLLRATNLDWLSDFQSLEYLDLSSANLETCTTWLQAMHKLTALKQLHLSDCELPTVVESVSVPSHNSSNSLVVLDLSFNSLSSGVFHWFLNMSSSITYIDLSGSDLEGGIPDALGSLMSLYHLDLHSSNLRGRIPQVLGNLTSLSYLDLSRNQLQGEFPRPSKNLSSLTYLDLSVNKLNGQLPHLLAWIGDSTRLEYLYVDNNALSGLFPNMSRFTLLKLMSLGYNQLNGALLDDNLRLPNLEILYLSSLKLEGVVTEAHLSSLPHLTDLDLSFNLNVTISITPSWVHRVQFVMLDLANCNLGPYFPKWLRNQKQLEFLDISNSTIFGIVPDWFWGNIHECWYLNMSHNHIHGVLPNLSSSLFKEIDSIDLSSNEFTGSLPILSPFIYNIDLSRNKFSGTILHFCNFLKNLYLFVDLSSNLLSGEIPEECFMNFFTKRYLNLAHNNFSGEIRTPNNSACQVFSLHLRNNSFRGEIPRSLMNCSRLKVLDLGENGFSGKIPGWLGESMPELGVLLLKSNMLSGSLPSSICHLSNLQVLDISMNKITGPIPKCINNFTQLMSDEADSNSWEQLFSSFRNRGTDFHDSASVIWKGNEETYIKSLGLLKVIDLSSNELTGEIPHELTSLIGIVGLNISGNNLVGFIPDDIDELGVLNFLDLSRNKLSGRIPPTLSKLSHLGVLNLSFNNLSGRIPWETHMQTFEASTYLGNPRLCGPPLVSRPCPEDVKPRNGRYGSEDEDDKFTTRGFYISMVLGFVVAFWVVFWTLFFSKWSNVMAMKIYTTVADWLYVQVLINKRRLLRYFDA